MGYGFFKSSPGERNRNAKVTNQQAQEIRDMYAAGGITQATLAKRYNLTQGNVSQIIQGKSYKVKSNEANPEEIQ